MKPVLVLALGNALAGDDAVGGEVARALTTDPAADALADVVLAGTDLFRHAHEMNGRRRVVIVDAALGTGDVASVRVLPHPLPAAERRSHAHALDPVGAVDLLKSLVPELAATEIWWLLVEVPEVAAARGLSAITAAQVPEAVAALRSLVLGTPRE